LSQIDTSLFTANVEGELCGRLEADLGSFRSTLLVANFICCLLTFALTDTKNVVPNTFTAFAFLLAAILQDAFASRTSNLTFFVTAVEYKWNTVSDIRRRSLADVIRGEEVKARLAAARVINWGVNSILAFASALLCAFITCGELTAGRAAFSAKQSI